MQFTNRKMIRLKLKKYLYQFILGAIIMIILSLLLLPFPLLTKHLLDKTIPQKNIIELIILIGIIILVLILEKFLGYKQSCLFFEINSKIVIDLKKDLIKKLTITEFKEYDCLDNGYLYSRINTDTERLRTLFADTIITIIKDFLTLLVGIVALLFLHWRMAIVAFAVLPAFTFSSYYFGKKVKNQASYFYEDSAQTSKVFQESIRIITLAKLFSNRMLPAFRFYKISKKSYYSSIKLGKLSFLNSAVTGFLGQISPIILVGFGGYEIMMNRLSFGELIAFNSFIGYLFGPTASLVNVNVQIQQARVALKRVKELFALQEEKIDRNYILPTSINQLELKNIDFSYETDNLILEKLSFLIEKGERIGIVGGSGEGKTTLIRIITGLYPLSCGEYLLNNRNLTYSQVIALRKCISIVEQEPCLLNDTVYNNISFRNSSISRVDVIKAAQMAYAEEFINNLENKYDTIINNSRLSIGQKQRIAIARAIIRRPKILILDEATSNIDTISEEYIYQTIANLPQEMIVIIVTHRLNTVRNCNRIMVMSKGKIIEIGSHDELMKRNGLYTKMINTTSPIMVCESKLKIKI